MLLPPLALLYMDHRRRICNCSRTQDVMLLRQIILIATAKPAATSDEASARNRKKIIQMIS
jgi:hypothetical protein